MNATKINFDNIQEYIKTYPKIMQLAEKYKSTPGSLVNFFIEVGNEVLEKTNDAILKDLETAVTDYIKKNKIVVSDSVLSGLSEFFNKLKSDAKIYEVKK